LVGVSLSDGTTYLSCSDEHENSGYSNNLSFINKVQRTSRCFVK